MIKFTNSNHFMEEHQEEQFSPCLVDLVHLGIPRLCKQFTKSLPKKWEFSTPTELCHQILICTLTRALGGTSLNIPPTESRYQEGWGEDPFLTASMATAAVQGLQNSIDNLGYYNVTVLFPNLWADHYSVAFSQLPNILLVMEEQKRDRCVFF